MTVYLSMEEEEVEVAGANYTSARVKGRLVDKFSNSTLLFAFSPLLFTFPFPFHLSLPHPSALSVRTLFEQKKKLRLKRLPCLLFPFLKYPLPFSLFFFVHSLESLHLWVASSSLALASLTPPPPPPPPLFANEPSLFGSIYCRWLSLALWRSAVLQSEILRRENVEHQRGNINDGVNSLNEHRGIDSSLQFVQPASEWHSYCVCLKNNYTANHLMVKFNSLKFSLSSLSFQVSSFNSFTSSSSSTLKRFKSSVAAV